jgi:hypothetical protein
MLTSDSRLIVPSALVTDVTRGPPPTSAGLDAGSQGYWFEAEPARVAVTAWGSAVSAPWTRRPRTH